MATAQVSASKPMSLPVYPMSRTTSRTMVSTSTYAWVRTSPITVTMPVVVKVSIAQRTSSTRAGAPLLGDT